jgi:hypothetical protein
MLLTPEAALVPLTRRPQQQRSPQGRVVSVVFSRPYTVKYTYVWQAATRVRVLMRLCV